MAVNQGSQRTSKPTTIQPADVALSNPARPAVTDSGGRWQRLLQRVRALGWPAVGFVALLLIFLLVAWWLPKRVDRSAEPEVLIATDAPAPAAPTGVPGTASGDSPFADAQAARARREAQDLLAELLKQQQQLEELSVREWAPVEYQQAIQDAEAGDAHYRNREFEAARDSYRAALTEVTGLLERSRQIVETGQADGEAALAEFDTQRAVESFERVLLIEPDNQRAQAGLRRAEVLDQVADGLRRVDQLERQGQLAEARQAVEQLIALDPENTQLPSRRDQLSVAMRERDYLAAMSRGYAALERADYAAAVAGFEQALAVKPGANDARQALNTAKNQSLQVRVSGVLKRARDAEKVEDWQTALNAYKEILNVEPKSVVGITGKVRAEARWKLDRRLQGFLDDPDSLLDPSVIRQAEALLADATGLKQRGPRLDRQAEELSRRLEAVRVPVTISLVSDGQTSVTVLRHGRLGKFETRELTVKPGKYVALGQRDGYRDVRVDFLVRADAEIEAVAVKCDEPISQGS